MTTITETGADVGMEWSGGHHADHATAVGMAAVLLRAADRLTRNNIHPCSMSARRTYMEVDGQPPISFDFQVEAADFEAAGDLFALEPTYVVTSNAYRDGQFLGCRMKLYCGAKDLAKLGEAAS